MKHSLPPTPDADCAAVRAVLGDLLANDADAISVARAEAHLAGCASCRFALASARAYRRAMQRVGRGERAPSSLRERAAEILRASQDQRGPQP